MVTATELRVGNYLSVYGTNGNRNGWSEFSIGAVHINTCVQHPDWFRGVLITEDLVKRMGFIAAKGGKHYKLQNVSVIFWPNSVSVYAFELGTEIDHIKFVHQLQNLYYVIHQKNISVTSCTSN